MFIAFYVLYWISLYVWKIKLNWIESNDNLAPLEIFKQYHQMKVEMDSGGCEVNIYYLSPMLWRDKLF